MIYKVSGLKLASLFICFFIYNGLNGQVKIPLDSVGVYVNKTVVVCGKIFSTNTDEKTGTVFLDMGRKYPNAKLTLVIFQADLKNFRENPETFYRDKNICLTGVIKRYKEKSEIIIKEFGKISIQSN